MNCLEKVFQEKAVLSPWENQELLPTALQDRYAVRVSLLKGHKILFLFPRLRLAPVQVLEQDIAKFQEVEAIPAVLVLDACGKKLSRELRQKSIPYLVPDKALYFPFMDGDPAYEDYKKEPLPFQLQPSAQMLLFYLLYQTETRIGNADAMKAIDVSGLTLSRAIDQLVESGCFEVDKIKAKRFIVKKLPNREIFLRMQPHLFCPIQSYILCSPQNVPEGACMAGIEALGKMLSESIPCMPCRAIAGRTGQAEEPDGKVSLQYWRYDPSVLAAEGMVDPLSLIMALKNSPSQIVQHALLRLLDRVFPPEEHPAAEEE